jgi:glycosyltransferase involved in cell wall biosynthesis
MIAPLVTIAVPSFNQADFLNETLVSIFEQNVPVEVFVMDGGSKDGSVEIIRKWAPRLSGWRSRPDEGQAAAINEGISLGNAPYVCWINSDDWFLSGGLSKLLDELSSYTDVPAVYGRVMNVNQKSKKRHPVWVEPFSKKRLAMRCIISQPGTLIRRNAWEAVGGLNDHLQFSMDYDLWWRLYKKFGELSFLDDFVAVNRVHDGTKTRNFRQQHNDESVAIVKKHTGKVPLKWLLLRPYSVWFRTIFG